MRRVKQLSVRLSDNEFHANGSTYEKAVLSRVDSFVHGTSSPLAAERKRLGPYVVETSWHSSMCFGAMPYRHLSTWTQRLNWTCSGTSSQCSSSWSIRVSSQSYFFVSVITRAAAFMIRWIFCPLLECFRLQT